MHTIAQIAAQGIVSCLVLGMLIATIAWLLSRVLPSGNAGLRFAVWFSALGAIALVPVVQNLLQGAIAGESQNTVRGLLVLPVRWAWYLFAAWATVAFAGVARVAVGAWHLWRLRSESTAVQLDELDPLVREAVERASERRRFEVRTSEQAHVPMAIGFLRPAVVFPKYLLSELSPEQLKQLVLHESTHLLRYDDWTNLLQKLMQAVLFFHPAVWWLENKLTLEREMACDEAVVAETHDARSYAECLAALAEKSMFRRSLALVQAAVSRLRHTSLRVEQVLALQKGKRVPGWGAVASVVGVMACAAVLVQSPDLVSFQNPHVSRASFSESEAIMQETGARVVPASFTSQAPRVVPAMMKVQSPSVHRKSAVVKPGKVANRTEFTTVGGRATKAHVIMTSHHADRPVPVLVSTLMVIESEQSGSSNQVWVVRTWHVALYYPQPEQTKQVSPRKI